MKTQTNFPGKYRVVYQYSFFRERNVDSENSDPEKIIDELAEKQDFPTPYYDEANISIVEIWDNEKGELIWEGDASISCP